MRLFFQRPRPAQPPPQAKIREPLLGRVGGRPRPKPGLQSGVSAAVRMLARTVACLAQEPHCLPVRGLLGTGNLGNAGSVP